jgi:glutathione synthase
MQLLVVMDPPSRMQPEGDTTLVIIEAALARGHGVWCCLPDALGLTSEGPSQVTVTAAWPVERTSRTVPALTLGRPARRRLDEHDVVLMRKDPPFDIDYYTSTLLLDRARDTTLVVNDPTALRACNEKLAILDFPDLIAPTFVTRSIARLRELLEQLGGEMIVKPLDGAGGAGVFYVTRSDRNASVILESLSQGERKLVMAQKYLPAAREGDKRILLLDGEPIGSVLRVPRADEHRGNLHVGGAAVRAPLTARELEICAQVGSRCQAQGLVFVGLDVIGGHLTEVNVTSPTGIQEANRLEGHEGAARLEARFVDWLERKLA